MREFLENFLVGLRAMILIVLCISGIFVPMILGIIISPWFITGYFISIPLSFACIDCLIC